MLLKRAFLADPPPASHLPGDAGFDRWPRREAPGISVFTEFTEFTERNFGRGLGRRGSWAVGMFDCTT